MVECFRFLDNVDELGVLYCFVIVGGWFLSYTGVMHEDPNDSEISRCWVFEAMPNIVPSGEELVFMESNPSTLSS